MAAAGGNEVGLEIVLTERSLILKVIDDSPDIPSAGDPIPLRATRSRPLILTSGRQGSVCQPTNSPARLTVVSGYELWFR